MKYAFALLLLTGCVYQQEVDPPMTPTIKAAHPDWSPDDVVRVESGDFWTGMTVEQFECSYSYGRSNNDFGGFREGPHEHRIFDSMTKTSNGTAWGYRNGFGRTVGYFDNDGKLIEYTKIVH